MEEFNPKVEIKGTEHLRHPCGLRLVRCAGAHPSSATVDQPILSVLLKSVLQPKEIAYAEPKKFTRLNTT